ncbi:tetraacyldisaccharide 4'-kinase [Acetobacter oryzifermentans]|uniref:Tetraacyldisaccharide 4'-kinase n=1 Tax=Acetobacter oryzifermentans TaxID=1633874 RepID=A0ABM6AJE8_9PROT|nr:tetraacyldisaccharide 4'-kinase [Acetobacter oryzifermentans]ANA13684.1 tetraacyldisaccharide 4'-kinase [Acetobacter oryzifermentans]
MVKLRAPAFWSQPSAKIRPLLLSPFAGIVAAITARKQHQQGWTAPVPVLCCGNISVGGAGKTTVVLDLAARLLRRGKKPHILTRGYGGRLRTTTQVNPAQHTAQDVGDEPLLLAQLCPVWVGADRAASARMAVAHGADCLLMDDGFQNPSLYKNLSLLVVDGGVGLGNGYVLPAGPLREQPAQAFARAQATVLIEPDKTGFLARFGHVAPHVMQAELQQSDNVSALQGQRCVAFAGLGRPEKFFEGLKNCNITLAQTVAFPDHYFYKQKDLKRLADMAVSLQACLVTTPKDAVRLPEYFRQKVLIVGVDLVWQNPAAPEDLLNQFLNGSAG